MKLGSGVAKAPKIIMGKSSHIVTFRSRATTMKNLGQRQSVEAGCRGIGKGRLYGAVVKTVAERRAVQRKSKMQTA